MRHGAIAAEKIYWEDTLEERPYLQRNTEYLKQLNKIPS